MRKQTQGRGVDVILDIVGGNYLEANIEALAVDGRLVVTRTRDGGRSFESFSEGLPPAPGYDLVYRHALVVDGSGRRLAMASTSGNLWISEDGGEHWNGLSYHLGRRSPRWPLAEGAHSLVHILPMGDADGTQRLKHRASAVTRQPLSRYAPGAKRRSRLPA